MEPLLVGWSAMSVISTYACWRYRALMEQCGYPKDPVRSVVVVPIKGSSQTTGLFLKSLLSQDHPDYRVIFAVESLQDEAVALIRAAALAAAREIDIIDAGLSDTCGQKVWNLRAALKTLRDDDRFIVMADADVILPEGWLSNLNWAVIDEGQEIVTGYRLILAQSLSLPAMFVGSINLSVATAPRITGLTAAWGGTMAMHRSTFMRLDLEKHWDRALSDDLQLTVAARERGILIHTNRSALLPTPWRGNFADLFEFGVRQFRILRLNDPLMHFGMLAALGVPIVGVFAAVQALLSANPLGIGTVLLVGASSILRGRLRRDIVRRALLNTPSVQDPARSYDGITRPLWWPIFFLLALIGSVGRKVTWAGVSYLCQGPRVHAITARRGRACAEGTVPHP